MQNSAQTPQTQTRDPDWWRGAVIYQIYPRSYKDAKGNGVGDLKGITEKLPYIASLGVDAIWISPFSKSPMKDFGYDVSDYTDVDPMFGTLADYEHLIETAHSFNIKVIIDLVISHSSDQHEWFRESRAGRDNPKADWYVWADAKPDGTPPNNWLSIFGGSAWQWDSRREQYYLHNFLTSQPDLNMHNQDVQDAVLAAARFWLERGTDGFRLDTINFYFHDQELRDNPALPLEKRNNFIAPSVNPYNYQEHLYSKNRPENIAFLKRFRALLDEYEGTTSVGEVGDDFRGLDIAAQYTSGTDMMHMCYAFEFLGSTSPNASFAADVIKKVKDKASKGWMCWALSNHDVVRHATRWCTDKDGVFNPALYKLFLALQLSLRGSVCLYQGEELGLPEAEVAFGALQDPYGIEFWPEFKGRDGCRTPMVWEQQSAFGGFSDAQPWLPVDTHHLALAVDAQEAEEQSMLHQYRRLIQFRAQYLPLIKGNIDNIADESGTLCFTRELNGERIFCAFNFTDTTQNLASAHNLEPLDGSTFKSSVSGDTILLPPHNAFYGHIRD